MHAQNSQFINFGISYGANVDHSTRKCGRKNYVRFGNDWHLRVYQNHANMSDTPLGSPAGLEDARNTIFLGHHLRKRREKGDAEAAHAKNTKVCRNLVPK